MKFPSLDAAAVATSVVFVFKNNTLAFAIEFWYGCVIMNLTKLNGVVFKIYYSF